MAADPPTSTFRQWCKVRIDECVSAGGNAPAGTVLLDGESPPPKPTE
ncbi:hypothetical protein [Streptomyces sp. NPDC001978]